MSPTRREQLRHIMHLAWRKLRWERHHGHAFTMSAALKHAWAWVKGEPEREAARAAWAANPQPVMHLRSIMRSPIRRALTGQRYAGSSDYRAAYTTARLGN